MLEHSWSRQRSLTAEHDLTELLTVMNVISFMKDIIRETGKRTRFTSSAYPI